MATYYANVDTGAGSILAANAWSDTAAAGGTPATFADGNAAGHTLDLNGLAMTSPTGTTLTCTLLQAATGTLTPTGTLTITGKVKYTGTSTSGMIIAGTDVTLVINGPGSGNAIENTGAGYAVVTSGNAAFTVTNTGATSINVSAGRGLSSAGTGAVTIADLVNVSGSYGVIIASTSASHVFSGSVTISGGYAGIQLNAVGGTLTCTGTSNYYKCTSRSLARACLHVANGTLVISGARTITAGDVWNFLQGAGVINLTNVVITNNGKLLIDSEGGTITATGTQIINNVADAQFLLFGLTTLSATAANVIGPTIPAVADVETGVQYGYAGDLQTGTLAAGGGVPVFGGHITRMV